MIDACKLGAIDIKALAVRLPVSVSPAPSLHKPLQTFMTAGRNHGKLHPP
jgi:hypothetical protein